MSSNVTALSNPATIAASSPTGSPGSVTFGRAAPAKATGPYCSLRGRGAPTGQSTVSTIARQPAACARSQIARVRPRSLSIVICIHSRAAGTALAMSSMAVDPIIDTDMTVPAPLAARAIPVSASGENRAWPAVGATMMGIDRRSPSTVVVVSTEVTSRNTRGRSRSDSHAATLAASVRSSPPPEAA